MTKNGIDVSEWQGDINWNSITTVIAFYFGTQYQKNSKEDKENENV